MSIIKATTGSGDAPDIADDVYSAEFTKLSLDYIEAFDTKGQPAGKYNKVDDGQRLRFVFGLLDEKGKPLFASPDDDGPVVLDALTSVSMNTRSTTVPRAVKYLKAIMTKAEFAAFEAGEEIDEESLYGRKVQVEVEKNEKDWPQIVAVMPAPGKK